MSKDHTHPESSTGIVRLFPLPNLVLFPGAIQPLHIFEPRYRQMMADALADDRLITMSLLRPGWEKDYHLRPPVHPGVCVGRIYQEELLADGRWNLLLHGERRARILEEIGSDKPYRLARVEWVADSPVDPEHAPEVRNLLIKTVTAWARSRKLSLHHLQQVLKKDMGPGPLCDILGYALPLPLAMKQNLLEDSCVEHRVACMIQALRSDTQGKNTVVKYPMDFSVN
jgi:Lon protease-like protein